MAFPLTINNNNIMLFSILVFSFVCISISNGFPTRVSVSFEEEEIEERECVGTDSGFSSSGTAEFHYNLLRKRYLGCTYVLGNLEITHLDEPKIQYDLSFLQHIRYVSGYVLIGLVGEVSKIPLINLEIIRGNHTFEFQGQEYSMMVALTSSDLEGSPAHGLSTLMMPKLKEISNGKVIFIQNPTLGYIDTIDWESITKGRFDAVQFGDEPYNQSVSNQTSPDLCYGGGFWGNDESLCQEMVPALQCDESCDGYCYGPESDQCCHESCALGCVGPTNADCLNCKDFEYEGQCVAYCPALTYQLMQQCIQYKPLNPLRLEP